MRIASFAALLALSCATPALAGGASLKDEPPPCCAPALWDGAYVGAFAGWSKSEHTWTSDESSPADRRPPAPIDLDASGFTGGVFAGGNLQSGRAVLGLEAEIGWLGGKATFVERDFFEPDVERVEAKIDWLARARLRMGYAMGNAMPFIAVGPSLAQSELHFANESEDRFSTKRLWQAGLNVGAGLDYRFSDRLVGRLEYIYDRFGDTGTSSNRIFDSQHFALDMHTVRAGIALQFGAEDRRAASIKDEPACCGPALWSGVYLAGFAGYQWGKDSWSSDETAPGASFGPIPTDISGFAGGILVGANIQRGAFVLGIEGEIGTGGDGHNDMAQFAFDPVDRIATDIDWVARTRLRVGHAFGNVMPFIAAGVALADTTTIVEPEGDVQNFNKDAYRVGLTFGAGVDYAIANGFFGRVEYLYDRYASMGYGSAQQRDAEYYDLSTHTVRAALAYKLDGAARQAASTKDDPACCAPTPWSGAYIGAVAGYQRMTDDWTSDETSPAELIEFSPVAISPDGFTGGVMVGTAVQSGSIVLGVEAEIVTGASERRDLSAFAPTDLSSIETDVNWIARGRVRLGYAFGNVMPFIAGGIALADTTVTMAEDFDPDIKESSDLYRVGFTVGAGVDYMVTPNIVLRGEYLYDQFTNASFGSGNVTSDSQFFELNNQTVRGAISLKLN